MYLDSLISKFRIHIYYYEGIAIFITIYVSYNYHKVVIANLLLLLLLYGMFTASLANFTWI